MSIFSTSQGIIKPCNYPRSTAIITADRSEVDAKISQLRHALNLIKEDATFPDFNVSIKHWTKQSPLTVEIVPKDQVLDRLEQIKKWLIQHYLTTSTRYMYQLDYKEVEELDVYAITLNVNPKLNKKIAFKIPKIPEKTHLIQSNNKNNPINLDEMIKNWTQETTLILEFVHPSHIRSKVKQIKKLICSYHLKGKDSYLYQIEVLDASSILPWITDKIEEDKTFQRNHAIALSREKRNEPELKRQTPFDFITLEPLPKEIWASPQYIYLPNNVMETKGCVKAIFNKNKKNFLHPIDNRKLSNKEHQIIIDQILKIFQISSEELSSCFDLKLSPEAENDIMNDKNNRIIDNQVKISQKAIDCLKYSYRDLDFDLFYGNFMRIIEALLLKIKRQLDPLIYARIIPFSRIGLQLSPTEEAFSIIDAIPPKTPDMSLQINVPIGGESISFFIMININTYQVHIAFQESLGFYKTNYSLYKQLLKAKLAKQCLLPLLFRTSFFVDEKKEALIKAKIKQFEDLTGISLTD